MALGCGLLYLCCDLFSWPLPSSLPKMSDFRPPPLVAPRPLRRAEEVGGRRQQLLATSTATEVEQRAVEANCLCLYRHFWDRAEQQQGQEEEECGLRLYRDQSVAFLVWEIEFYSKVLSLWVLS